MGARDILLSAGEARVLDLRGSGRVTITNEGRCPAGVRVARRGGGGWVPLDALRLVPGTCWSRAAEEIGSDNMAVELLPSTGAEAVRVALAGAATADPPG